MGVTDGTVWLCTLGLLGYGIITTFSNNDYTTDLYLMMEERNSTGIPHVTITETLLLVVTWTLDG